MESWGRAISVTASCRAGGGLGAETPVKNCHGIVCDREENLILLTDEVRNNFIAYDPSGKRLHKWSRNTPGRMTFPSSPRAGRAVQPYHPTGRPCPPGAPISPPPARGFSSSPIQNPSPPHPLSHSKSNIHHSKSSSLTHSPQFATRRSNSSHPTPAHAA